ncbi:hypothetical protein BDR05DRAFT_1005961 [Suillus weaverae]|nr:hypothetical protein BDR05DRAFT_1005961 [Suillus weaverae]
MQAGLSMCLIDFAPLTVLTYGAVEITGKMDVNFKYLCYEAAVVQEHLVKVVGWNHKHWANPSDLKGGIEALEALASAVKAKTCKFVKITTSKAEERLMCIAAGEVLMPNLDKDSAMSSTLLTASSSHVPVPGAPTPSTSPTPSATTAQPTSSALSTASSSHVPVPSAPTPSTSPTPSATTTQLTSSTLLAASSSHVPVPRAPTPSTSPTPSATTAQPTSSALSTAGGSHVPIPRAPTPSTSPTPSATTTQPTSSILLTAGGPDVLVPTSTPTSTMGTSTTSNFPALVTTATISQISNNLIDPALLALSGIHPEAPHILPTPSLSDSSNNQEPSSITSGRKHAAPNTAQSSRSKRMKKLMEKALVNEQLSKGRGNRRKKKGTLEPKSSEWVDTEDENDSTDA